MRKIREVLRLKEESALSDRKIADAMNVSRPMVSQWITNFRVSGESYASIVSMDDEALHAIIGKKSRKVNGRYISLVEKFEYFSRELKRKGVTLQLLWEEYSKDAPHAYSYAQFCYHYQTWRESSKVTMHMEHKAGEKMFVDYTGHKLKIYDRQQPEKFREVEVFVAILGASQLTYIEASESQKKEDWLKVSENALWYFEGVPGAIVPDCLKSAVAKADRYEPDINPTYSDFARHYGTVIVPARSRKPQDKALVENAVKIAYMRIFAPLRNMVFYSLDELNEALWERMEAHNNKAFERMNTSRWELYRQTDKEALKALPMRKYEHKEFLSLKVQFNYHIEVSVDQHYYSVPWQYCGKRVSVEYTGSSVEIFHKGLRIASHQRDRRAHGYSTCREHMPPQHQFVSDWSPERMISWGEKAGSSVKEMIEGILRRREFPEQAYKVCLGILSLSKKYGNERLNNACKRAIEYRYYSYKAVKNILEKGLDRLKEESSPCAFPCHSNIRGSEYFN
jgi:transposase